MQFRSEQDGISTQTSPRIAVMYAVVVFSHADESEEVAVVPRSWVAKDSCWWPTPLKGVALTKAIQHRNPPESGWTLFTNVTVLKETESYEKAQAKCRKAERNLTDLDTTDIEKKRKRQPRKRFDEDSDEAPSKKRGTSDSDGNESEESTCIETKTKKSKKTFSALPSLPNLPPLQKISLQRNKDIVSSDKTRMEEDARIILPSDPDERERKLYQMMLGIKLQVQQNTLLLKQLLKQIPAEFVNDQGGDIAQFGLPMATEVDVETVETLLQQKEMEKTLVHRLASLGGVTSKEVIDRMMASVMSNFSYAAKLSKIKEAETESVIKKWLKYAADRDGGRKRRAEKQKLKKHEMSRTESDTDSDNE